MNHAVLELAFVDTAVGEGLLARAVNTVQAVRELAFVDTAVGEGLLALVEIAALELALFDVASAGEGLLALTVELAVLELPLVLTAGEGHLALSVELAVLELPLVLDAVLLDPHAAEGEVGAGLLQGLADVLGEAVVAVRGGRLAAEGALVLLLQAAVQAQGTEEVPAAAEELGRRRRLEADGALEQVHQAALALGVLALGVRPALPLLGHVSNSRSSGATTK